MLTPVQKLQHWKGLERSGHYLQLGYSYSEIVTKKLFLDDELWEKVKDLPVIKDNPLSPAVKALRERNIEKLRESFRNIFRS